MAETSFRALVEKFLKSYEILPQSQVDREKLIDEIVKVYKPKDADFVPSFARWFGDMLIGGGIKVYG